MTNEFKIISEDGLKTLCKAIKKVSTVGEIIDDDNSVTDKTYSSFKIDERLNAKIDKTQLTTVLDESVTDDQIPGAKTVYNTTVDKNIKTYCLFSQLGLSSGCSVGDIFNAMPIGSIGRFDYNGSTIADMPSINGGVLLVDKCNAYRFSIEFKESAYGSLTNNNMWIGQLQGSDGSGITWTKVCTSSVEDVNKTSITFTDSTYYSDTTNLNHYYVINGICYVSLYFKCVTFTENYVNVCELPKAKVIVGRTLPNHGSPTINSLANIAITEGSTTLQIRYGTSGATYYTTFSYPVAE